MQLHPPFTPLSLPLVAKESVTQIYVYKLIYGLRLPRLAVRSAQDLVIVRAVSNRTPILGYSILRCINLRFANLEVRRLYETPA